VRVYGFLLGNNANWPLMRTVCDASGGFYAPVSNADDLLGQLMLAKSKITHEAMHDVSVKLKGVDTFDLTNDMPKKIYRGEQLVIFGRYDDAGKAKLSLTAHISGEDKLYETQFEFPEIATDNPEIERLWAMSQIEQLEDQVNAGLLDSTEGSDAIADLGVAYQLVTDETAMLVLHDADFERYGIDRANRDRVATENQAQARRASQTVVNNRVDRNDPLFNLPTPSLGGGALDPFSVLIVAGGVGLCLRRRKDQSDEEEGHVSQ
jgi:Ca-activated chloride channel family protein